VKRLVIVCSDGIQPVDIQVEDPNPITTWFTEKGPNDVLVVSAQNVIVCLQKRHVVRIEVSP
jgi:hypothetical protein